MQRVVAPVLQRYPKLPAGPHRNAVSPSAISVGPVIPHGGCGWMVIAMLLALFAQVATGLFSNDDTFTDAPLAHHLTKERVWENLCHIPTNSAPGVDGQTVAEAKENFGVWIEEMLQSVHRQGYTAPDIRRLSSRRPTTQRRAD